MMNGSQPNLIEEPEQNLNSKLGDKPTLKQVLVETGYNLNHEMNPETYRRILKDNEAFKSRSIYPRNYLVKATHSHKFKRMVNYGIEPPNASFISYENQALKTFDGEIVTEQEMVQRLKIDHAKRIYGSSNTSARGS